MPKLAQKGVSYGKKGGNGLGLFHAKKQLNLIGGDLKIESTLNKGTTIILSLNKSTAPHWFTPCIILRKQTRIVILDDDQSFHKLLETILSALPLKQNNIEVFHFQNACDFKKGTEAPQDGRPVLYLVDHELSLDDVTGLDLIEQLSIQKHAILITNQYLDQSVLEKVNQLKLKLIPKPAVNYIRFECESSVERVPDTILIDDDELVRDTWKIRAKQKQVLFKAYSNSNQFFKNMCGIPKGTKIYIDSDLNEFRKGEEIAKDIAELGFDNIYLATGYQIKTESFPWIKKVVSKNPPW